MRGFILIAGLAILLSGCVSSGTTSTKSYRVAGIDHDRSINSSSLRAKKKKTRRVARKRVKRSKKQRVRIASRQTTVRMGKSDLGTYKIVKVRKVRGRKARRKMRTRIARARTRGRLSTARKSQVMAAVRTHARNAGISQSMALAVVRQESSFNPKARGSVGEIGLMQVKCATARSVGYKGKCKGLYNVNTNLKYGMRYLKKALKRGSVGYYNAGIHANYDQLTDADAGDLQKCLSVNTAGVSHCLKHAGRKMENGGAIVNISSVSAVLGVSTLGAYAASKGAVLSLTKVAAIELASRGIRVNAICPGSVRTPMAMADGAETVPVEGWKLECV